MSTHTYKKCPHCSKTYEAYSTYTKGLYNHSGSPFITCKYCGGEFVDRDIKEPALKPYTGAGFELWRCFLTWFFPFGAGGILFTFCAVNSKEFATISTIISVICFGYYVALTTYSIINRRKFMEKDKAEYIASEKRLQNLEYALALKKAGFKVPDKYLQ